MVRTPRLFAVGALTALFAAGCGGAAHQSTTRETSGRFPIVVAHPNVQIAGLPSALRRQVQGNRALLLSPSRVAFTTTGTVSCAWLPTRLTVVRPSAVRIDMRVNGRVSQCGSGGTGFPIAVKIDPRVVDVKRPVTLRLAYKVRLPNGGGTRRWNRTAVAPALRQ